jgi:predicted Holliday junction resolvase-like endonuclease
LPAASISSFIHILVSILTLVILYQTWQSSDENHEESIEIQKSQLDLSREQFEYNKEQDKSSRNNKSYAEKERENIQKQIDELRKEFDKKLKKIEASKQNVIAPSIKSHLKGNCRNKPCPCGSGKKAKKCHPNGYST